MLPMRLSQSKSNITLPLPAQARSVRQTRVCHTPTQRAAGFSLLELMVVIIILGVLGGLAVQKFFPAVGKANKVRVEQDIRTIQSALDFYRLDNFRYPSSDEGLEALVNQPGANLPNWSQYLKRLPKDPWGNPYSYLNPGTHSDDYDIFSMGADGAPGGEGDNADLGSWDL